MTLAARTDHPDTPAGTHAGTGTSAPAAAARPAGDWDGPPYLEHPLDPAVRRRAGEEARALLKATRSEPGVPDPWEVSEADLEEIVELVLRSAWGTFRVAVSTWESDTGPAAPETGLSPSASPEREQPPAPGKPKRANMRTSSASTQAGRSRRSRTATRSGPATPTEKVA